MGISTRIQMIERDVFFAPGSGLSPQDISAQIAEFARGAIAEADATNADIVGHAVPHETFVDGTKSDALEKVDPKAGVIVAEWSLDSEVVQFVWEQIKANSPVKTGKFRDSQRIYADGVEVDTPEDTIGASEVIIASTEPYARKIEARGGDRKAWATNSAGLYHAVAAMAASRFGNIARIKFSTREIVGGDTALAAWAGRHSAKKQGEARQRRQRDKDSRQPAVVITFR